VTPTETPTPTPTNTPFTPQCDAGGPYNLGCVTENPVEVQLNGTGSHVPADYTWDTDCLDGVIIPGQDPLLPFLRFTPYDQNQSPVSCKVYLFVDAGNGSTSQCESQVSTEPCDDCPNGRDRCGVCEGDGTSCITCTDEDQTALILALDGNAANQLRKVSLASKNLRRAGRNRTDIVSFAKLEEKKAKKLYDNQWKIAWVDLAPFTKQCDPSPFCVEVSNVTQISTYKFNASELHKATKRLIKKLRSLTGDKSAAAKLLKRSKLELSKSLKEIEQYPSSVSSCN